MSTETPPINGADPADGLAVKAAIEDAHNHFLDRVVDNIEDNFELMELTEQDVALVTMGLMVNSFCRVFKTPTEAATKLEEFVAHGMRRIRHNEATKLILPASASKQ